MIAGAIFFCWINRAARSGTFSVKPFQLVCAGPLPMKPTMSKSTGKRRSANSAASYCGGSQTCSGRTCGSPSGLLFSTFESCCNTTRRPGEARGRLVGMAMGRSGRRCRGDCSAARPHPGQRRRKRTPPGRVSSTFQRSTCTRDPWTNRKSVFDDGAAYEDFMGKWSQLAGDTFLQWLAPPAHARWVDVGCGNGAFTEMLARPLLGLRGAGHRSVRSAARVRAHPPRQSSGAIPDGRRHGLAARRRRVRCRCHGAGHLLRARPGEGRCPRWRVSSRRAAASRPTRGTSSAAAFRSPRCSRRWRRSARRPCGRPSVDAARLDAMQALWRGAGLVQIEDTRDRRAAHLRQLRVVLGDRADRPADRAERSPRCRPAMRRC